MNADAVGRDGTAVTVAAMIRQPIPTWRRRTAGVLSGLAVALAIVSLTTALGFPVPFGCDWVVPIVVLGAALSVDPALVRRLPGPGIRRRAARVLVVGAAGTALGAAGGAVGLPVPRWGSLGVAGVCAFTAVVLDDTLVSGPVAWVTRRWRHGRTAAAADPYAAAHRIVHMRFVRPATLVAIQRDGQELTLDFVAGASTGTYLDDEARVVYELPLEPAAFAEIATLPDDDGVAADVVTTLATWYDTGAALWVVDHCRRDGDDFRFAHREIGDGRRTVVIRGGDA